MEGASKEMKMLSEDNLKSVLAAMPIPEDAREKFLDPVPGISRDLRIGII